MSHQGPGWGYSFERTFTKYPPGLEGSTSHDRLLRYPIGELSCVVGFEVDACYEGNGGDSEQGPLSDLQAGVAQLSLTTSPEPAKTAEAEPSDPLRGAKIMP